MGRGPRNRLHARERGTGDTSDLSAPEPPTAIVYDSDLLAVTGLGVAQHMGFSVPDDLSIVGSDDSLISQVVHPPLTAITRDIQAYGAAATRHLLLRRSTDGRPRTSRRLAAGSHRAASTGRAPAAVGEPQSGRRPAAPLSSARGFFVSIWLTLNRISDGLSGLDGTLERIRRGARAGRPRQCPGSGRTFGLAPAARACGPTTALRLCARSSRCSPSTAATSRAPSATGRTSCRRRSSWTTTCWPGSAIS